ncbi:alpha/beta hydrolase [Pelagibaculum spongiae]|uniref:AB hydrolase-1 domain-containing protein n=1 Tax=Pelagibaculum spongiae TaxID=2080658 RepID=A0A2V1GW91_9GAMM|nr:alpha/beta hydrolase [Pelagibaculum spongiae]PVZ69594.1 hypothetical protein DC094_09775 [Pelagibaculum spongiae]
MATSNSEKPSEKSPDSNASNGRLSEKPIIFLIHGVMTGNSIWSDNFLPWLEEKGYRVCAPSLPCHGEKFDPFMLQTQTIESYLDFLVSEIEKLPEPPVVMGFSMGGALLARLVEKIEIKSVVFVCSLPLQGGGALCMQKISEGKLFSWSPGVLGVLANERLKEVLHAESAIVLSQLSLPYSPGIELQKKSVLVVASAADDFVPEILQRQMAEQISADYLLLENAGHCFMLEQNWQQHLIKIEKWISA